MNRTKGVRWIGVGATLGLLGVSLIGPGSWAGPGGKTASRAASASAVFSNEDLAAFSKRFQTELWPLLTRAESHCAGCHTGVNASQLRLSGDPDANFKTLLADGHFDAENPASLLARVTTFDKAVRMPPAPFAPWKESEIAVLRAFVNDLYAHRQKNGAKEDEQFPTALLTSFKGKAAGGLDNTFLTYYQLRGKVRAIFDDDWRRSDHDLFAENLAQFGGADFVRSFNESNRPTAPFLSGVDALARDVASRAYLAASGPFVNRAERLPSPLKLSKPDAATQREIGRLYRRMLFRDPTPAETQAAFGFLQGVYRAEKEIASQGYTLRFELTARDASGLTTGKEFSLQVVNDRLGLCQTLVNQNDNTGAEAKDKTVRRKLDGPFTFKAGETEQGVAVYNDETHGSVVVQALEVRGPLPETTTRLIPITDPSVQPQGAWKLTNRNGVACYEDENNHKGASRLWFPVKVEKDGKYEVSLLWRKGDRGDYADNVLVEAQTPDATRLAIPAPPPLPPKGEARFTIDETDDTLTFADLKTAFRFSPGDGIEISNENTRKRVVADAVKFVPIPLPGVKTVASGAAPFLVPAKEAEGQADWKDYKKGTFIVYKPVGPRVVSDENDTKLKGKLHLLYRPAVRATDWKPETYYRVEIGYPGEVVHDTAVPVRVLAQESSPIVQLVHPLRARVGAMVILDAGASFNVQRTPLQFTWRQVGGAYVRLTDPHAAKLTFTAPAMSAQQAAWEGLCRALMKHRDFLFTRPVSLATCKDPATRRRLLLVKIAQDLVGRTPSAEEFRRLEKGASPASLVADYLNTQEFADFYFRRIRLYLESHGTEEDDEPARLWTYIALNNRPFKDILTADYTVDTHWEKQPRPDYYGKSGLLTMKGFIKGKPGLPHFNYAAQVCEKFLGYVFEVPAEIVKMRDGITAASTTSPGSVCYSCHKILTPLAYQRTRWTDDGLYRPKDSQGRWIDDSDNKLVASYAFKGNGLEAFALQAQNKERFIRTMIQTHFVFYFGREMRCDQDERGLYRRLWETERANNYSVKGLIKALLTSPEYLEGHPATPPPGSPKRLLPPRSRNLARR